MSTARVDLNATIAPQLATVANVHAERIDDLADDQRKILVGASPIVLDIETVADLDWIASSEEAWLAAYDPPGNMTKPETIAANIAEALKSRVSKAPLRALDGKVIAAGIARLWGDGDPVAWAGDYVPDRLAVAFATAEDAAAFLRLRPSVWTNNWESKIDHEKPLANASIEPIKLASGQAAPVKVQPKPQPAPMNSEDFKDVPF